MYGKFDLGADSILDRPMIIMEEMKSKATPNNSALAWILISPAQQTEDTPALFLKPAQLAQEGKLLSSRLGGRPK